MIQLIKLRKVSYVLLRDQTEIDVAVKGLLNSLITKTTVITRVAIVKFEEFFVGLSTSTYDSPSENGITLSSSDSNGITLSHYIIHMERYIFGGITFTVTPNFAFQQTVESRATKDKNLFYYFIFKIH